MNTIIDRAQKKYLNGCLHTYSFVGRHPQLVLLAVGIALIQLGTAEMAHAGQMPPQGGGGGGGSNGGGDGFDSAKIREAWCKLLQLIEGPFGGLVATAAGIGAIIASAMGAFKSALSLLVTSAGAFILRSLVSLFFGSCE